MAEQPKPSAPSVPSTPRTDPANVPNVPAVDSDPAGDQSQRDQMRTTNPERGEPKRSDR